MITSAFDAVGQFLLLILTHLTPFLGPILGTLFLIQWAKSDRKSYGLTHWLLASAVQALSIGIAIYTTAALTFGSTSELLLDGLSFTLSIGGQWWISRYAERKAKAEFDRKMAAVAHGIKEDKKQSEL